MTSPLPWLDTTTDDDWPAKARRLSALARAGLPVPPGLVVRLDPGPLDDPEHRDAIERMLARGPVVVRSALAGEDDAEGSAAGLGHSRLGCTTLDAVREALRELGARRHDPWLVAYRRGSHGPDRAIVQQEIPRRILLVVAVAPSAAPEIEAHAAGGEALAQGRTPEYAGRLAGWDDPAREAVAHTVDHALARLPSAPHGHDLELVVDPEDRVHLVQARPLVAPLHPGWARFERALRNAGQLGELGGVLTLDVEHNPAPLSPAHADLMRWLGEQRPGAGEPTVLAGWLYVRTLPRDLASGRPPAARPESAKPPEPPSALAVVRRLHHDILPRARAQLREFVDRLPGPGGSSGPPLATALPLAQRAFLSMIDAYVGTLIPARTRARRALGGSVTVDRARPLSTRGRDEFLDVLPAAWDLASPSLGELGARSTGEPTTLPDDEASATTLLGEWDDHLFALGLAPLRAWMLAAGRHLGLPEDDVFLLTMVELSRWLDGGPAVPRAELEARRRTLADQATLQPPLRIEDGRPVCVGRRARLRGIPLGASFTGRLAPRSDLAALLADPPAPDAIVTMPALTAPAAVALRQLGVRAVCCEHGGPLSHAALMVRELELSALVGCRGCTELPAGRLARIDTTAGRLVLLAEDP